MEKIRTFFAVDIPESLQQEIMQLIDRLKLIHGFGNIKWVGKEKLHITTRFLGNISQEQIEPMVKDVKKVMNEIEPFSIKLSSLILFPSPQNPRVIALKPEPLTYLITLNQLLERAVAKYDVQIEHRSYVPHLTLGRIKHKWKYEFPEIKVPQRKFSITEVILYHTEQQEQGSVYVALNKIPLGGSG